MKMPSSVKNVPVIFGIRDNPHGKIDVDSLLLID